MSLPPLPHQITVTCDIMMLAQPQLGSPVLMWCPTSTLLQPLDYQDGFFKIRYRRAIGFLPAAVCRANAALLFNKEGLIIFLGCPQATQNQPTQQELNSSSSVIPTDEPLLVLGEHDSSLLVQRPNGSLSFVPNTPILPSLEKPRPMETSCGATLLWLVSGTLWALYNWWGVHQFIERSMLFPGTWSLGISWLVLGSSTIAMCSGHWEYPARIFLIGPLIVTCLIGIIVLVPN